MSQKTHLVEMVVKSEHLLDFHAFHDHLGRAVGKGPFLILIEPFKHIPSRLLNLIKDMDYYQNASGLHQIDSACADVADIPEQQRVTFIQDEVRDVEAGFLLDELLLKIEGCGVVFVSTVIYM